MTKLPSMPFFPADFFADTEHLSRSAAHAYLFLLGHAWLRNARLPNDDAALARMAGFRMDQWRKIKPEVMAFWKIDENGMLWNLRQRNNFETVNMVREIKKANGVLGGRPKSLKSNTMTKANGFNLETEPKASISISIKKEKISKKEKVFKHELPEGWQPDESDLAYSKKLGLLEGHFDGQVEALRLWAKANKILKVDWHATLKGFLRRDAEKRGVIAPSNGHDKDAFVFIKQDTPQWSAWTRYYRKSKGKSPPTNTQGGWHFPTEWPPK